MRADIVVSARIEQGERFMLLIGNQGVGKNKLADRLLQLLNMEREYIQLHRDTTVQVRQLSRRQQLNLLRTRCCGTDALRALEIC